MHTHTNAHSHTHARTQAHLIHTATAVINEHSDDARTNASLQKDINYLTQLKEVNLTMMSDCQSLWVPQVASGYRFPK